ncbi:alanine racemase, partial [Deinococcus pimensis]|uniref:alanine racemase n=1 Tax=Deinococcus pimensis TaxID=309888 RepID=UPI0005EAD391
MHARARAEFLADAYRTNLRLLSAHAGVPLLLPIKADAYGHGARLAVEASRDLDVVWGYAVATPREALDVLAA